MSGQFHDFDAAWADDEDEPVVIKLLGEEWKCKRPSEVPAAFLLRLDRLVQVAASRNVPDDFVVDDDMSSESVARTLAGDDNVDAWLSRGLSYMQIAKIVAYLNAVYHGQDPDAGEAKAANRETRRAAAKPTPKPRSRPKRS